MPAVNVEVDPGQSDLQMPAADPPHPLRYCPLGHDVGHDAQVPAADPPHPLRYCPLGHDVEHAAHVTVPPTLHLLTYWPLGHEALHEVYVAENPAKVTELSEVNVTFMVPPAVSGPGTDEPLNGLPDNSDTVVHEEVEHEYT